MVAMGRVDFGVIQALTYRYAVVSVLLVILIYLSFLEIFKNKINYKIIGFIVVLCLLFNVVSYIDHNNIIKNTNQRIMTQAYLFKNENFVDNGSELIQYNDLTKTEKENSYLLLQHPNKKQAYYLLIKSISRKNYYFPADLESYFPKPIETDEIFTENYKSLEYDFKVTVLKRTFYINNGNISNIEKGDIFLILKSKNKTYLIEPLIEKKPALSKYLNKKEDYIYFNAFISKEYIEKGNYIVGIGIKGDGTDLIQFTDKSFKI
jgi:hypothetical protein